MNIIILLLCAVIAVTTGNNEEIFDESKESILKWIHELPKPNLTSQESLPIETDKIDTTQMLDYVKTNSHHINSTDRIDDYIKYIRLQFEKILENYDVKMKQFREQYLGRLEIIHLLLEMVSEFIARNEAILNPMEFLSDLQKQCVRKYRSALESAESTKAAISNCSLQASEQLSTMLHDPLSSINSWQYYYTNTFETDIATCNSFADYTRCLIDAVSRANKFAIENGKIFDTQLEAAECTAKINIKQALACSYSVESNVISRIAETNVDITKCIAGELRCTPCLEYSCDKYIEVPSTYATLNNPFYGPTVPGSCVMLKHV